MENIYCLHIIAVFGLPWINFDHILSFIFNFICHKRNMQFNQSKTYYPISSLIFEDQVIQRWNNNNRNVTRTHEYQLFLINNFKGSDIRCTRSTIGVPENNYKLESTVHTITNRIYKTTLVKYYIKIHNMSKRLGKS